MINLARGQHLVDDDLIQLLDEEHLESAILDVFQEEPLPKESQFWSHPKVLVTPHVASMTDPQSVVDQIYKNIQNVKSGEELINLVDRSKNINLQTESTILNTILKGLFLDYCLLITYK